MSSGDFYQVNNIEYKVPRKVNFCLFFCQFLPLKVPRESGLGQASKQVSYPTLQSCLNLSKLQTVSIENSLWELYFDGDVSELFWGSILKGFSPHLLAHLPSLQQNALLPLRAPLLGFLSGCGFEIALGRIPPFF